MNTCYLSAPLLTLGLMVAGCCTPPPESITSTADSSAKTLEPHEFGEMTRLHVFGDVFLGSAPSASDLGHAKESGIRTVVNLRAPDEHPDFDEKAKVEALGLEYRNPAFSSAAAMTDAKIDEALQALDEAEKPLLLHCKSSNRVGAIWAAYRVTEDGLDEDAAFAEARTVGLRSPELEQRIRSYLSTR